MHASYASHASSRSCNVGIVLAPAYALGTTCGRKSYSGTE